MHTYEDFKTMLFRLNEKLIGANLSMQIYAIGGFAMMCNGHHLGFDTREISIDIDSYNQYNESISKLIEEVADEFDLDEKNWINTEWRDLTIKTSGGIEDWIITTYPRWKWNLSKDIVLSNIELFYANVEGLLAMKLRAVELKLEQNLKPRLNDVDDLIAILSYFREDVENINNEALASLFASFHTSKEYLINLLKNNKN